MPTLNFPKWLTALLFVAAQACAAIAHYAPVSPAAHQWLMVVMIILNSIGFKAALDTPTSAQKMELPKGPMVLLLLLPFLGGCLRLQPKPTTALEVDCAALDNAHVGWTAASMAALGLSGAGGVTTAAWDNQTGRIAVGSTSAVLTAIGGVFLWVGNYYSQQYTSAVSNGACSGAPPVSAVKPGAAVLP
jgi:hypothetical protein